MRKSIMKAEQTSLQDQIMLKRIQDIKTGKVEGMTETDLNLYLKKRGVKI